MVDESNHTQLFYSDTQQRFYNSSLLLSILPQLFEETREDGVADISQCLLGQGSCGANVFHRIPVFFNGTVCRRSFFPGGLSPLKGTMRCGTASGILPEEIIFFQVDHNTDRSPHWGRKGLAAFLSYRM